MEIKPVHKLSCHCGKVELELTDQAISRLLLQHLQPRFRALIEGIVG